MKFRTLSNTTRYGVYNFFQKDNTYIDPKGK